MQRMSTTHTHHGRNTDARLRNSVLRLGETLGWQHQEVRAFTEALTARPWQRCRRAELELVLREYGDIAVAIAAKRARRRAGDHSSEDDPDAPQA